MQGEILSYEVLHGDCREVMAGMDECSVDSIVTDPPYGLSFMGKGWDKGVPGVEFWVEALRVAKPGAHLLAFGGTRMVHRLAVAIEDAGWEIRDRIHWVYGSGFPKSHNLKGDRKGWGTALKPAVEPIILARKPFKGTVAANVLEWGTGAINVDGCRVPGDDHAKAWDKPVSTNISAGAYVRPESRHTVDLSAYRPTGRFPANLIHDGSDEATAGMGDASRYFYCAKANKRDRGEGNNHPTVKPTDLMAYLCRLITPPGGTVLDPFNGSGSTGKAAVREGFNYIGIELDPEYAEIARARIASA